MCEPLRVLSLFAGIGGIDLGLERAGMRIVAHAEVEPHACRVLAKQWPSVPNIGDVQTADWSAWAGLVDVIAGGFPCQDVSLAGKRAGLKEGTRSGLWSHFAHAIRTIRPRYVIVENVPGLATSGLTRVLGDLAACGFDASWRVVSAADMGAPHLRRRVFVVANAHGNPVRIQSGGGGLVQDPLVRACTKWRGPVSGPTPTPTVADSRGTRNRTANRRPGAIFHTGTTLTDWITMAHSDDARREEQRGGVADESQHPTAERAGWWSIEPDVGRMAHGIPSRVDRLRALGNAVVPHCAQFIGELVVAHHRADEG